MPFSRGRVSRPAMYNTPAIRNGGFGALQVEAITNRPLSIARRHLAASQLRMRDIEPDELSSSEWVRFLVMEEHERDRWMTIFTRRRRNSGETSTSVSSSSSVPDMDRQQAYDKAEEARLEAEEERMIEEAAASSSSASAVAAAALPSPGRTPAASLWARQFDDGESGQIASNSYSARRPMHARRAVTDSFMEAPPTYSSVIRTSTPPPAYEPESSGSR
nr:hypothetical protein CFP56_66843 [Quercus suber]